VQVRRIDLRPLVEAALQPLVEGAPYGRQPSERSAR
jgi:hypothetical protein